MSFYEWSKSMSVGVESIDSDHKALIDLINRLHQAVSGEKNGRSPDDIIDTLIAYSEIHFSREEKVMQACGFPGFAAHQEEHVDFTERVYEIREKFVADDVSPITENLLDYLKGWLNAHILIQDMAYKPYIAGHSGLADVALSFGPGLFERRSDLR